METCLDIKQQALTFCHNQRPDAIAFDGSNYYFLLPGQRQALKTDRHYHTVEQFQLCRDYDRLCYDPYEQCFWATAKSCSDRIFRLSCGFLECDCLILRCQSSGMSGAITGLSYNCCNDKLLVSFAQTVATVCKCTGSLESIYRAAGSWITGVFSLCPGTLVTKLREGVQQLVVLDSENQLLNTYTVDRSFLIRGFTVVPGEELCQPVALQLFTLKNGCYPQMFSVPLLEEVLGYPPCSCNLYTHEQCCTPVPYPCHSGDACSDVIESVALIETALSHILNAEGEKLQKVLATTDDLDKILETNREITRTIIHVTHLEHALYDKLSCISDCVRPPPKPPCCCQ